MSFHSRKLIFGSPTSSSDPYFDQTSLLLHGDGIGATPNGQQNNTFLDSSSNNFTITRSGTPTQGSFSPFALNGVAYSPTLHGGSAYLSLNNQKLTLPSTAFGSALDYGTGSFTIECWYNFIQVAPNNIGFIISQTVEGNNNLLFMVDSTRAIGVWLGGFNLGTSSVGVVPLNTWCHVALVRNGSTVNAYVNGISVLTSANSSSIGGGMNPCINGYAHTSLFGNTCYISNMRITKGLAVYTSNFTPPTSPVTLTSNGGATPSTAPTSGQVSLLCNFTNGGIFDNTKKNNLTTVGDAKVSTFVVKYGTGSIYFDGTGDLLTAPSTPNLVFGTGNFTVECWVNVSTSGQKYIVSNYVNSTTGWSIHYLNGGQFAVGLNGDFSTIFGTTVAALNTWYHLALVGSSNSYRLFVNGVQEGATYTGSVSLATGLNLNVGGANGVASYVGYIDDLRITKGIARYTSNFTPPARAFPDK